MRWFRPWTLAAITLGLTVLALVLGPLARWAHVTVPGALVILLPNLLLLLLIASVITWIVMTVRRRSSR